MSSAYNSSVTSAFTGAIELQDEEKVLENYLVGQRLGEGAYGSVYVAKYIPSGERFALKILQKTDLFPRAYSDAAANINHDNDGSQYPVTNDNTIISNALHAHNCSTDSLDQLTNRSEPQSSPFTNWIAMQQINLAREVEKHIIREATVMQALSHPHVVKFYKFLSSTTAFYLIMELAEGGELFDLIISKHHFSEDESRMYFQQLMSAIDYCHSNGVAHKDLKAENLLLSAENKLLVCDFGFSTKNAVHSLDDPDDLLSTEDNEALLQGLRSNAVFGTLHYMSPEAVVASTRNELTHTNSIMFKNSEPELCSMSDVNSPRFFNVNNNTTNNSAMVGTANSTATTHHNSITSSAASPNCPTLTTMTPYSFNTCSSPCNMGSGLSHEVKSQLDELLLSDHSCPAYHTKRDDQLNTLVKRNNEKPEIVNIEQNSNNNTITITSTTDGGTRNIELVHNSLQDEEHAQIVNTGIEEDNNNNKTKEIDGITITTNSNNTGSVEDKCEVQNTNINNNHVLWDKQDNQILTCVSEQGGGSSSSNNTSKAQEPIREVKTEHEKEKEVNKNNHHNNVLFVSSSQASVSSPKLRNKELPHVDVHPQMHVESKPHGVPFLSSLVKPFRNKNSSSSNSVLPRNGQESPNSTLPSSPTNSKQKTKFHFRPFHKDAEQTNIQENKSDMSHELLKTNNSGCDSNKDRMALLFEQNKNSILNECLIPNILKSDNGTYKIPSTISPSRIQAIDRARQKRFAEYFEQFFHNNSKSINSITGCTDIHFVDLKKLQEYQEKHATREASYLSLGEKQQGQQEQQQQEKTEQKLLEELEKEKEEEEENQHVHKREQDNTNVKTQNCITSPVKKEEMYNNFDILHTDLDAMSEKEKEMEQKDEYASPNIPSISTKSKNVIVDPFQQDLWSAGVILYFMLTGRLPFEGRDDEETLHLIEKNIFSFSDDEVERISPEARELISRMLSIEPLDRPTIHDILHNAWFATNLNVEVDFPHRPELRAELVSAHILIEPSLTFLDFSTSHAVTTEEEEVIEKAFNKIDSDGYGEITREQIRDMLTTLHGDVVPKKDIAELMKLFTGDESSESITFEQFREAWVSKDLAHIPFTHSSEFQLANIVGTQMDVAEREVVRQLRVAFNAVDETHSGVIHLAELKHVFDKCSIDVDEAELESLMRFFYEQAHSYHQYQHSHLHQLQHFGSFHHKEHAPEHKVEEMKTKEEEEELLQKEKANHKLKSKIKSKETELNSYNGHNEVSATCHLSDTEPLEIHCAGREKYNTTPVSVASSSSPLSSSHQSSPASLPPCSLMVIPFDAFVMGIVQRDILLRHPMGRKLAAATNLAALFQSRNVNECVRHGFVVVGLQNVILEKLISMPSRLRLMYSDEIVSSTENIYSFRFFGTTALQLGTTMESALPMLSSVPAFTLSHMNQNVSSAKIYPIEAINQLTSTSSDNKSSNNINNNNKINKINKEENKEKRKNNIHENEKVRNYSSATRNKVDTVQVRTSSHAAAAAATHNDKEVVGKVEENKGKAKLIKPQIQLKNLSSPAVATPITTTTTKKDLHASSNTHVLSSPRCQNVKAALGKLNNMNKKIALTNVVHNTLLYSSSNNNDNDIKIKDDDNEVQDCMEGADREYARLCDEEEEELTKIMNSFYRLPTSAWEVIPNDANLTSKAETGKLQELQESKSTPCVDFPVRPSLSCERHSDHAIDELNKPFASIRNDNDDNNNKNYLHETWSSRSSPFTPLSNKRQSTSFEHASLHSCLSSPELHDLCKKETHRPSSRRQTKIEPTISPQTNTLRAKKCKEQKYNANNLYNSSHGNHTAVLPTRRPPTKPNATVHNRNKCLRRLTIHDKTLSAIASSTEMHNPTIHVNNTLLHNNNINETTNLSMHTIANSNEEMGGDMVVNYISNNSIASVLSKVEPLFPHRAMAYGGGGAVGVVSGICDVDILLSPACIGYTLIQFRRIHGKTNDFHEAVNFITNLLDLERQQAMKDTMTSGESELM